MWPIVTTLPDWAPGLAGAPLFTYGLLLGTALIVGFGLAVRLAAPAVGLRAARVIYISTGLFGWLGARLIGPWLGGADLHAATGLFAGGGVAYAGVAGGLVGLLLATRLQHVPTGTALDAATVGTALGIGLVRIGCLLHGCDYGAPCSGPLTITYPLWHGLFPSGAGPASAGSSVFPVQAAESVFCLVLFVFLLVRWTARRSPGRIAVEFFASYAVARFLLEWLRGDADRGENVMNTGMSTSQILSILALGAAVLAGLLMDRAQNQQRRST